MILSAITAVADNQAIGLRNQLPWRMPADMRYFKNTTWGHPVIMGRKTYASFGKALPGRENLIVTRNKDLRLPDAVVCPSLEEAIRQAGSYAIEEVFVLGGAEIYAQSLPMLDRIYLTRIEGRFEADAFFPLLDPAQWALRSERAYPADSRNPYPYRFQIWERTLRP